MVFRRYYCPNTSHSELVEAPLKSDPVHPWCKECDQEMYRDYKGIQLKTFKPFESWGFGPEKVEVTSAAHRERLCEKYNATFDTGRYVRRKKAEPLIQEDDFDTVMTEIQQGNSAIDELVTDDTADSRVVE